MIDLTLKGIWMYGIRVREHERVSFQDLQRELQRCREADDARLDLSSSDVSSLIQFYQNVARPFFYLFS